jgi:hypothetical protein
MKGGERKQLIDGAICEYPIFNSQFSMYIEH